MNKVRFVLSYLQSITRCIVELLKSTLGSGFVGKKV